MANPPFDFSGVSRKRVSSKSDKIGECFGEVARKAPEANKITTPAAFYLAGGAPPPLPPSAFRFVVVVDLLLDFYLLSHG